MLRKIRISLALVFFVFLTLLFLDFTGFVHSYLAWIAEIQFIPALLAHNAVIVAGLLLLAFLFGRIYCSVICPLGVMQDIVSRFSKKRKSKRNKPFKYSKPLTWLRWVAFAVFTVLMIAGAAHIAAIIEPYSAFGKIVANLVSPVYKLINNGLAYFAEQSGSYAFYSTEVWIKSGITFAVSLAIVLVTVYLAWTKGRLYCNAICPVGTLLGLLSKFSLFKPVINKEKCNRCGVCALKCKSQCIDSKEQKIDYSRCVACFDCIENCSKKALKYEISYKTGVSSKTQSESTKTAIVDNSKRDFLTVSALIAATAIAKAQKSAESAVDGGLAVIEDKKLPKRTKHIVPPGAQNLKHFHAHCTACQLCIAACPEHVLRPSADLAHLMQPEMQYDRGYCRPECTRCADVCPTEAIKSITVEEKSSLKIGTAVLIRENCVVITDEVSCINCERHCPTKAISLVPKDPEKPRGLQIPVVDTERCIGCGACENLCPARPFSAIYVEGDEEQRFI